MVETKVRNEKKNEKERAEVEKQDSITITQWSKMFHERVINFSNAIQKSQRISVVRKITRFRSQGDFGDIYIGESNFGTIIIIKIEAL